MITTTTNVVRYVFSHGIRQYAIPFKYTEKSQIKVIGATDDGIETELEQNTQYSLTNPAESGSITILDPYAWDFSRLAIRREIQMTQETDYKNGEPIDADVMENNFDRVVMQIQQIAEVTSRAFVTTVTEEGNNFTVPGVEERKNQAIGFDSTGKKLKMYPNPGEGADRAEAAAKSAEENAKKVEEIAGKMWAYSTRIGDGRSKEFTIRHVLDSDNIIVQLWAEDLTNLSMYTLDKIDKDTLKITFEEIPAIDSIQVVITCMGESQNNMIDWDRVENVQVRFEQIMDGAVYSQQEIDEKYQTMTPADIENVIGE